MESGYLVISCNKFDFKPEGQLENVTGLNIVYLEEPQISPNFIGSKAVKVASKDLSLYDRFIGKDGELLIPAYYDLFLGLASGAQGKAKPVLKDIKFLKKVTL